MEREEKKIKCCVKWMKKYTQNEKNKENCHKQFWRQKERERERFLYVIIYVKSSISELEVAKGLRTYLLFFTNIVVYRNSCVVLKMNCA